ncbi:Na+ dependent nucleoside transporter C-terminus-domain-containing protein [Cantharellus anzutake]|uniref:Na+ dependent nucleoside transporter C-terminus-domain-containing protein n=1 Tax=Cantharellus anzutake TaxID=1750568 RepID=UPI001906A7E3|nr:Na+ dependent nucleoside transporter C-terminus-domain-containing protein [Cantharellus anzutake]KAF8335977.1 Na+ dependent nucleoside transporter C-terminus-domain-containing protein [Cantharellus anzutake]
MADIEKPAPIYESKGDSPAIQELVTEEKHNRNSTSSTGEPKGPESVAAAGVLKGDDEVESGSAFYAKYRPFILAALALVILGWWISSTIVHATRHRWIVQTFWAWTFISIIAFRFIPNSIVTKPVAAVWYPLISDPFFSIPYYARLATGWLALIAVVFGSAFGFSLPAGTHYGDRAISVLGLFAFQCFFYAISTNRSRIPWPTVIVGLFVQQIIALFVLKSDAGFKIFLWVATLAQDFLARAEPAAAFFFDEETIAKHWFFTNVLSAIIFFIAFVQMMYYFGVMQWFIGKFAWVFFKLMNISGAEAVVAAASPFIGQGESACLVRPYVDLMTPSELHLSMTSGFSTIAGSVFAAYVNLGVSPTTLITSSVMSIPASIAISKLRFPETDEPVTRGRIVVDRGAHNARDAPVNALHAYSQGATFGLLVAGQILTNVLTILALVYMMDGLLTWIGKGFGIHNLTLDLIFGYVFCPLTFLMGVPRGEIIRVSRLIGLKFVANEFVAYSKLSTIMASTDPLSERAFTVASYGLCGFGNLGSLGIQIGVLSALAPSRARVIAKIAPSALLCGFIATMQTAGIAGMLV